MNYLRKNYKKAILILLLAGAVGGAAWLSYSLRTSNAVPVKTFEVTRGKLARTVEVIGTLEPEMTVDLSFQQSGKVAEVLVDTGNSVKKGDILARLENADQAAVLSQAKALLAEATATLNLQLAAKTTEDVEIAKANLEQATANFSKVAVDYDNAKTALANTKKVVDQQIKSAELDLKNAELNLEKIKSNVLTTGSVNVTAVNAAKASLKEAIGQALSNASVAVQTVDKLYGFYGKQQFVEALDFSGESAVIYSTLMETLVSNFKMSASLDASYRALSPDASVDELTKLSAEISSYMQSVKNMVLMAIRLLNYVLAKPGFTIGDINSYRTELNTVSSGVDVGLNSFNAANSVFTQAVIGLSGSDVSLPLDVRSAEVVVEQKQQALEKAKIDGDTRIADAESVVKTLRAQMDVQRAGINSAQFALNKVLKAPREVDVAPYRARVLQARAQVEKAQSDFDKTFLRAPIDGVVTYRAVEVGEQVNAGVAGAANVAFRIMDKNAFHVDVHVPETKIDNIDKQGVVNLTFDALDAGQSFEGEILAIDPAATVIDNIVYYKVKVGLKQKDEKLKAGMTVNVTITALPLENALYVPEIAVFTDQGEKFVNVMREDGTKEKVKVRTGARGNGGMVEITTGLKEGQKVIIS